MNTADATYQTPEYRKFRTGLTYQDVYRMMWSGDAEDSTKWRYKGRSGVLGYWHELKKLMWVQMQDRAVSPESDDAGYPREWDTVDTGEPANTNAQTSRFSFTRDNMGIALTNPAALAANESEGDTMATQNSLSWNDLFMSGSIIHLKTSEWRARTRIKAADLGIEDTDEVSKALALGNHRMAPAEAFEKVAEIIAKARRAIDHYSLPFGLIKGARYVPEKNTADLAAKLRELKTEFDVAVTEFMDKYDSIKAEMLPVIEKALKDAARNPEAARTALERVEAEYPMADVVRSKFRLIWQVYAIQGPRRAGAVAALADESSVVKDALRDMIEQLREEVTGKLADVITLVKKGGKLQQRSIESALAVLDHVDTVNVMGDATLAQQVKALRISLRGINPEERVTDADIANLGDIKKALEGSIEDAVKAAEQKLTKVGKRKLAEVA